MSTKDLFKKGNKVLTKSQEAKIKSDLESTELVRDVVRASNKFHSHVDYSKPENFAFYGSAQKYYEDSFNRVYQTYPYDGSLSEKEKWFHDSSELDLWILDNAYPKSAGHVKLGTNQSITVKGGPNNQPGITAGEKEELSKQYPVKQGNSNIWDTSIYRNSNLYIDGTLGNTIEFWAKLEASVSGDVYPVVVGNENGNRIQVQFNTTTNLVSLVYTDDTDVGLSGASGQTTIASLFGTTWAHYAFSFVNSGSNVKAEIYKNGTIVGTITSGTNLGTVSQKTTYLRANGTAASTNTVNGLYLDEFRFWKRIRTAEEIGRYWLTNVNGGTNTDDNKYNTENRKVDLGIYYKFNEGITGDASIDTTVLDYSGRISNGTITNYTSTVRVTTSAFDESGLFEVAEEKDLVIYSSHPDFVSAKKLYMDTGLVYDYNNNSSIYHTMPAWIIEEDDTSGQNTKELTQIMSSYFDSAQVKIKELVNLKDVEYHTLEERTNKPYSLIRKTLESAGMVVPDLFTEASAFEEILSRGEKEKFEEKLQDVKNTIYQNIYNNLSYIYKSKGTEKSFRNLIRCFGIDDELLKINMYSDGADYLLEDSRRTTAIKKKFVDFNHAGRDQGLVYTKVDSSNSSSTSYIRGVGPSRSPNLSFTFETEVIFPKRVASDHPGFDAPTNLEEHIAYLGEYTTSYSANDLFDLKAVKEGSDASSENVKFVLTMDGQTLETQFFKSVYENSKWNLAVRLVPKKSLSGVVSGGSTTDYRAELYCVRMLADVVEDEQLVTADITEVNARALLAKDKYISIGALHSSGNPESASLDNDTRVKISSTLFWYDNLTNEEIKAHASDASNFGRLHPSEEAYSHDAEFATIQVPKRDTLAMHWDFSEVSTTDGSGEFIVNDLSQGNTIFESDVNKKAILLDGTDDIVVVSDQDAYSPTDGSTDKAFSISAWIYVGDVSADNGPFVAKSNNTISVRNEYIFKHASGEVQFFIYDSALNANGNALRAQANAATLSDATWHHVVMTYDGSTNASGIKIYTDGSQTATTNSEAGTYVRLRNTATPLTFGATEDTSNANRVFEDKLADICIFDKELSATEVTEIYNSNQVKDMSKFSAYDNIISWWKMGDDLDATGANGIKDYKGSHHGTLTNGASIVDETTLGTDSVVDGRYGWFTNLVGRQVTGRGKHFTNNDKQIVNREYVHSAKHRPPEVINSEDLIEIRSQDDLTFTKDAQITTHFFAAEKSMYQVISDDMINLFATIVEFNDLIGQPVNRYRMEYKTLEKFRARYFEKVNNVPSLEKYIELYKWIDSSIGLMIQELIPVSSNFSADLRNMVESHVLERNKYWTKFPTLEMSGEPPMGVMRGINELTYNWKEGTAPVGSETTENDKFLWGDKRVNASDITTGNSTVDDNREILRRVATRTTEGMVQVVRRGSVDVEENKPILRTPAGAVYQGRTFANRALSKPYKLNLDIAKNVHGGVNYSAKTKDPNAFIRAATRIIPGDPATVGIAATLATNPVTYEEWKKLYTVKRTVTVTISDTELSLTSTFDGDTIYPYYGYRDRDAGIDTTAVISGHHNDSYGDDAEIPMQGPFTETWVGGNQHRHVHLLTGLEDTGSANFTAPTSAAGTIPSQPARTSITVADNDDFSFTDGSSQDYSAAISLWVKPNSDRTVYLLTKVDEWNIHISSSSAVVFTIKDGSSFTAQIAPGIATTSNEWHHLVVNFKASISVDSSQIELWVNGVLLDTDTEDNAGYHSMDNKSTELIIGNFTTSYDQGMNGQMRDVAIFNFKDQSSALSAADIAELYNDNIAGHPKVASLVGWWKLHKNVEGYLGRNGTIVTTSPGEITFNALPPRMNSSIRPEFYLDDSGVLKHPHEVGTTAAARYTRDEVAKRPVNIRNIKTNTTGNSPLGNYARDYEVVQTSGRTQNNSWFVASGSGTPTEINHPFVVGDEKDIPIDFVGRRKRSADFALPDRGRSEHVIVERFSAPGESLTMTRGYLDRVAEEFSPYAGINNRNLDVRSDYAKRLYTHSGFHEGSQGYESSSPVLPSVHKVNRNTFFRPVDGGCTTDYDNAYVNHQIPRSDLQYAFVTASIDYDKYRTGAADERYPYDQCSDPAADKIPVLFSGYYDEIHVQKGNEGYNAPYADFQGGGWRFIRNVENPQVVNQRKTNTYSQLVPASGVGIAERTVNSYIEPAVVWNKPNTHYVLNEIYDAFVRSGTVPPSVGEPTADLAARRQDIEKSSNPISYSYSNNLEMFSNEMLTRAVDIDKTDNGDFSETLMEIFKKAELLFSSSVAREIIFPKHKNVGLKKTRTRTKFDTYKFFWKDKMFDRVKCSNTTKLGYEMTPEFKRLFKQKFSVDVMDGFHFHQTDSTDNEYYKVIGDLTYMGEDRMRHMITRKDLDLTDSSHPLSGSSSTGSFLGLEGICEAQATSSDIVPVYSSSEITRNKTAPIPSPQLYHNPYNENYKESEGWINRKPITSGQKVNYNDYDSFSEEVKLAAQNYGLVSEFRISEHMDKYILENGGNFRVKNYDFLTLDGASHDGESHTLSSGTSIKETSTFYSLKKEDDSLAIAAYPTSSTDTALVKNNAEGFFGLNPIYTPAGSDFDITNSVNSEVEILASDVENYISINPYQDGVSAAGKFNLSASDNDYLDITLDNFTISAETTPGEAPLDANALSFHRTSSPDPVAVSIWAQPEETYTSTSKCVWSLFQLDGGDRVCLFSQYHYSDGEPTGSDYRNLGLTLVATDSTNDGIPGQNIDNNSTVYTFFKSDGTVAFLENGKMNNIVLQVIPPETASGASINFLIKAWLNGEELYGIHVRELDSTIYSERVLHAQAISAYSPCPIGMWQHSGINPPWHTYYDASGFSDNLNVRGLSYAKYGRLGMDTSSNKFRGLLDEFTMFRGILPSSSITAIYNNGVPNNVNELVANGQIVGNGLYEGTTNQNLIINGQVFSYPVPATVDNGEFDIIGYDGETSAISYDFQSTAVDHLHSNWTSNESDETEAYGPKVKENTASTNKALVLRGYLDSYSDVTNPPGPTDSSAYYRWVSPDNTFASPISISFKAYEGRSGGDYTCINPPESNQQEYLWLQYKIGASGAWRVLKTIKPGENNIDAVSSTWDLQNDISAIIGDVGQTVADPLYLRWICHVSTTNATTAGSALDLWAIDDIVIKNLTTETIDRPTSSPGLQRISLNSSATGPRFGSVDFENNYSIPEQQSIEASLPVWHRIGVPSYDKVVTQGQWDNEFFSSYVHTDDINFIEAADAKHDELGLETKKKVRLKVNAIKKLLPYEGFYPQDRTVQLANLFVEKISPDILHNEKVYKDQAVQAALQHFFAPGILYNSIKAGIACDWASYTNESGIEPSYFGSKINILDSGVPSTKYSQRMAPIWYLYPATIDLTTETFLTSPPVNVDTNLSGPYGNFSDSLTYDTITTNSYTPSPLAFDIDYLVKDLIITKAPSKRLPFESILEPYKYLKDGNDGTLQDAAGTEKIKKKPNQHFLMNPSYYKDIIKYNTTETTRTVDEANSNYKDYNYPYFEVTEDSHSRDSRYEMAMNNFLAESTKFFIKGEQLSSFASNKPQGSGFTMDSGKVYYMDVVLSKSKEFSIVNSPGSLGGRYFGPPVRWIGGDGEVYQDESGKISDAAFAPYTPSYFYAESRARIKFTPPTSGSTTYTLDEIFELSEVMDISDKTDQYFSQEAVSMNRINPLSQEPTPPSDLSYTSSPAYTAKMPLSASIELFGKTKLSRQEFDADGNPTAISSANNTELDTWVIYTKFECPLFDFSDSSNASDEGTLDALGINKKPKETLSKTIDSGTYDYTSSYTNTQNTERFTTDKRTGSGIWAGYGKQQDGNGVTISIRESFPQGVSATTGSLIDVCGFTPETKQVGRVADEKEITESVIMIPFLDKPIRALGSPATVLVDDKNFIKINKLEYREQERKHNINGVIYTNEAGEEIRQTSITNMIEGMKKYNVPPLYDFETFEDQDPFVMYFFEFKHTLDREDLSNIWQGVQPKIAKKATLDSVEIDHEINPHEFFGNIGELPEGIRWMTFKVKRKAEKSYYKMTQDSRDDSRFKFDFEVGTKEPEYGYNYPYDYFTMLEMIQVEANSEKQIDPLEQYKRLADGDEE